MTALTTRARTRVLRRLDAAADTFTRILGTVTGVLTAAWLTMLVVGASGTTVSYRATLLLLVISYIAVSGRLRR